MMGMKQLSTAADLKRQVSNMVFIGCVKDVYYSEAKVTVQSGDMVTGKLNWLVSRAGPDVDWSAPEVGEQVVVLCPDGDTATGFIIGSLYQSKFPAPETTNTKRSVTFEDGTKVEYDKSAHKLKIDIAGGDVEVNAEKVSINKGTGVVTKECICSFTGSPHPMASIKVTAGL